MREPILWTPPGCKEALRLECIGSFWAIRTGAVTLVGLSRCYDGTFDANILNVAFGRGPTADAALNAAHAKMLEALGGLVPSVTEAHRALNRWIMGKQIEGDYVGYEGLGDGYDPKAQYAREGLTQAQLAAWLTDRMRQYRQSSGTFHAFELLIDQVEAGDPWERLKHGELDDLLEDK